MLFRTGKSPLIPILDFDTSKKGGLKEAKIPAVLILLDGHQKV